MQKQEVVLLAVVVAVAVDAVGCDLHLLLGKVTLDHLFAGVQGMKMRMMMAVAVCQAKGHNCHRMSRSSLEVWRLAFQGTRVKKRM